MIADTTLPRMIVLTACALAALALAGCGVRGGLERAAPLWGEPAGSQTDSPGEEDEDEVEEDDFLDPDDWRAPG